jgi:hypothetical protein
VGRERGAEVESRRREREMLDQSGVKKGAILNPASGKLAVI